MSGFDENPFGEPNVNDPFADPTVRRAASSIPSRGGIDDYNPFADESKPSGGGATTTQVRGASNPPLYGGTAQTQQQQQQPAMLPLSQEAPPPNYARAQQQQQQQQSGGSGGNFSPTSQPPNESWRRSQDMTNTPYYPRRNNWPPLPERCCVQPCFYQDIDVEIQTDFQKIVRQLYYLWIFHGMVLILNMVGGLVLLLAKQEFSVFGLSLLYLILFTPFSFICWFRPAYQAFKTDSSFNFMVFFFVFFFQTCVTVIQALGIPGTGACGLILMISTFDGTTKGTFVGVLLLCITCAYAIASAGDILLLSKVHRIYRQSPTTSYTKAQEEFTSTFFKNEHVQNATSNVAGAALRAQVNNMNSGQPRY